MSESLHMFLFFTGLPMINIETLFHWYIVKEVILAVIGCHHCLHVYVPIIFLGNSFISSTNYWKMPKII